MEAQQNDTIRSDPAFVQPLTVRDFQARKRTGERLVLTTAYDALFGRLVDDSGIDAILVGDSVGTVLAGFDSTIPVTLDQMIYHATMVRRGVRRAFLIVDMPFLTCQTGESAAVANCGRVIAETDAQAVKIEGGSDSVIRAVRAVTDAGIPAMGHIGYVMQAMHSLGRARVQGRDDAGGQRLRQQALRLEEAGVFALVLELVPARLAAEITRELSIPTIGIGAGPDCDGQILVLHDLLGLNDQFDPRFLKRYANLAADVRGAVRRYVEDVRAGGYPDAAHTYGV